MSRLCHIEVDDSGLPVPTPEIEQERRMAIYDLLEENSFSLPPRQGQPAPEGPFRQVVKDYFQICESYFEAVKRLPPSQIEAIDMARRGIHNEGARVLQERLEGKADVDTATARRLFTLICVLHWG